MPEKPKSSWEKFQSDDWRSNEKVQKVVESRHEPLESEMPVLNDNDVWFYQLELERFIERNMGGGRLHAMLRVLGAQARRKFNAEG